MTNDRLEKIFESKAKSTAHFRSVQERQGMLATPDIPVNLFTREGTIELHKGLHWINLELQEFIGASKADQPEELADVLHFLVEFCLLANEDFSLIPEDLSGDRLSFLLEASAEDPFVFPDAITNARFTIMASLHIAEMLKNKPWKQTLKTDLDYSEFDKRIRGLFYWYGATVRTAGLTAQELYDQFMRKEVINYNRIAGGV